MLEAQNISIKYGARTAVDGVSLRAEPGRVISILGPNGAGKSTLLRALNGSIAPSRGEVWLDQKPLTSYARRVVARLRCIFGYPSRACVRRACRAPAPPQILQAIPSRSFTANPFSPGPSSAHRPGGSSSRARSRRASRAHCSGQH